MRVAKRWGRWLAFAVLAIAWASAAAAQDSLGPAVPDGSRVALVIGNANYQSVTPLANPGRDAEAVAAAFTRLGFDVLLVLDADQDGMRGALQAFEERVEEAEVAVVYYAGHGIEVDGYNYLIPIDAELRRDTHVLDEAIPLDRIMVSVEAASALRLIILDACRDNPFAERMERTGGGARSVGRGLARVDPTGSTMIVFATREGTTADDGDGEHSPFTAALLTHLETPGLEVGFVFRYVRDDVMAATEGRQEPVWDASLGRTAIYFLPTAPIQPNLPPIPTPTTTEAGDVIAAYNATLAIDTIEAWAAFLRYHPTGLYSELARAALNKLQGLDAPATETPPPEPSMPVFFEPEAPAADVAGGVVVEEAPALPPPPPPAVVATLPAPADTPPAAEPGAAAPDPAVDAAAVCDAYAAYRYDPDRPEAVAPVSDHELERNIRPALEACRLAAASLPSDRRMQFQLARVAFIANRPDEAHSAALAAADLGGPAGMVSVGLHYEYGVGVRQDYAVAADWYRRGADAGSSDGMLFLGYLYDQGIGVALDLAESRRWLMLAADAGNAGAAYAIGYRYEVGRGETPDLAAARAWYERGALGGDGYAMQALGTMHEFGEGGPVDYVAARGWYERAAEQGIGVASASLGYLYELGLGVTADLDLARQWYERGAADGDYVSMFALGRIYEGGIGVPQNYEEAIHWYAQSALTDQMPYALVRLGYLFDQGLGVDEDPAMARTLWEEAAAAGEADALVNLGYLYEFGRGVEMNLDTAAAYYIEALSAGSPMAITEFLNYAGEYPLAIRTAVEQFLIDRGLLAGKADGIFDAETHAALGLLGQG